MLHKNLETQFENLFKKKGLSLEHLNKLANNQFKNLTLESSLDIHIRFLFQAIYSFCYPGIKPVDGIARSYHGIAHVSRVAWYISVFANLYKKYHHPDADKFTDRELKLTQLAGVLHDAAREDEEKDYWDQDSGLMCYYYFRVILKLSHQESIFYSEVIANKDVEIKKNQYHFDYAFLEIDDNHCLIWKTKKIFTKPFAAKLLENGDCLDIIRARAHFLVDKLDFYNHIAAFDKIAEEDLALLIIQARSLIAKQGDSYFGHDTKIKNLVETPACYSMLRCQIEMYYFLLHYYGNNGKLLVTNSYKSIAYANTMGEAPGNQNNINSLAKGEYFLRGVVFPSAKYFRIDANGDYESLTAVEIRKMLRDNNSRTYKPDSTTKKGNKFRSVSPAGYGGSTFTPAGFGFVNTDYSLIHAAHESDADTGWLKKKKCIANAATEDKTPIETKLQNLQTSIKLGGNSRRFTSGTATHAELLMDITHFDFIWYTNDYNFLNGNSVSSYKIIHKHAAFLQAVYILKEYERLTGRSLPIYYYSGVHNIFKIIPAPEYTELNLFKKWLDICEDIMLRINDKPLFEFSADEIKTLAIYHRSKPYNHLGHSFFSPDSNYSLTFQNKLNQFIDAYKLEIYFSDFTNFNLTVNNQLNLIFLLNMDMPKSKKFQRTIHALIKPFIDDKLFRRSPKKLNLYYTDKALSRIVLNFKNASGSGPCDTVYYRFLPFFVYQLTLRWNFLDLAECIRDKALDKTHYLINKIREVRASRHKGSSVYYSNLLWFIVSIFNVFYHPKDLSRANRVKQELINLLDETFLNIRYQSPFEKNGAYAADLKNLLTAVGVSRARMNYFWQLHAIHQRSRKLVYGHGSIYDLLEYLKLARVNEFQVQDIVVFNWLYFKILKPKHEIFFCKKIPRIVQAVDDQVLLKFINDSSNEKSKLIDTLMIEVLTRAVLFYKNFSAVDQALTLLPSMKRILYQKAWDELKFGIHDFNHALQRNPRTFKLNNHFSLDNEMVNPPVAYRNPSIFEIAKISFSEKVTNFTIKPVYAGSRVTLFQDLKHKGEEEFILANLDEIINAPISSCTQPHH